MDDHSSGSLGGTGPRRRARMEVRIGCESAEAECGGGVAHHFGSADACVEKDREGNRVCERNAHVEGTTRARALRHARHARARRGAALQSDGLTRERRVSAV